MPAVSEVMGKGRMVVMLPGMLLNNCSRRLLFWYFQWTLWTWDRSEYRHPNSIFEGKRLVLTVDVMQSSEGERGGAWEEKGKKMLKRDETNEKKPKEG